ncbi:DUF3857 domain-containing protein [bacterium]|nr:DUF3857 domain-containing protein [bacterium]
MFTKKTHFLTLTFYFLLLAKSSFASLVDEGWQEWIKNNHETALQKFETALQNKTEEERALASLVLINEQENFKEKAWKNLEKLTAYDYNYFTASISSASFKTSGKDVEKLLQKIIQNPDKQGFVYAFANEFQGDNFLLKGELKKAEKDFYSKLGFIKNWAIIGTFDNVSNSGFDTVFPPETEIDFAKTYEGKDKTPAFWFVPPKKSNKVWIDFAYNFTGTANVAYAVTFVKSETEQNVDLRLGTSGSFKLWLNEKLILSEEEELDNGIDTFNSHTQLHKGWNKILIKLCHDEGENLNFALRFCDEQGKGKTFEVSPENQIFTKADKNFKAVTYQNPTEEFFKTKIKENPKQLENYFYLANFYNFQDRGVKAELVLRELLGQFPNFAFLNEKISEAYLRSNKNDEYLAAIEKVYNLDKKSFAGLSVKLNEFIQNENLVQAEETANYIFALNSDEFSTYRTKILLAKLKKDQKQVQDLIYTCGKLFPENLSSVLEVSNLEIILKKDYKSAERWVKNFLKEQKDFLALNYLYKIYSETGNSKEMEKTFFEIQKYFPHYTGPIFNFASYKFGIRDYKRCIELCDEGIKLTPSLRNFWTLKGDCQKALGKNEEAKNSFKTALSYFKGDYVSREKLRQLSGKTLVSELLPKVDLKEAIKNSPESEDFPEDAGVILVEDNFRVVYEDGASETYSEILVKIFNASGSDDWQQFYIDYNEFNENLILEQAKVIKANGNEIQADYSDGAIIFKGIEPNDFIHAKWRKVSFYSGYLSEHFWDRQFFQSFYPQKMSRYGLLVPENFSFDVKFHNIEIEPQIFDVEKGTKFYLWKAENQVAMKVEAAMPTINDSGKWLFVSSIKSWEEITNWYYKIARGKAKTSFEIQEKVAEITKDLLSDDEKIKALYTYIIENIRYSSVPFRQSGIVPQKSRDTLVNKIGDCKDTATLMVSMLDEIGINAYQVLVNTRDEGTEPILPSPEFNHCIVAVEKDTSLIYLDLTAENMPYKILPTSDQTAYSLLIKKGNNSLKSLPKTNFQEDNLVSREIKAKIDENGNLEKESVSTKKGILALGMRSRYRNIGEKEKFNSFSKIVASEFANSELTDFNFDNLNEINEPIKYSYSFKAKNYATTVDNLMIVKIPWTDALKPIQALGSTERNYDYELWNSFYNYSSVENLVLDLPKGFKPKKIENNFELTSKAGTYKLTLAYKDGKLTGKREFYNTTARVPKEDFNDYKNYVNKVIENDSKQFVLEKENLK